MDFFDPDIEADWHTENATPDGHGFDVICEGEYQGRVNWDLIGRHNVANALMALAEAPHAGVLAKEAIQLLGRYKNVKRHMELRGEIDGIRVYDDFAHHLTAIETTLDGLRNQVGDARIIALLEPGSHTMKQGVHADQMAIALQIADRVMMFIPDDLQWDTVASLAPLGSRAALFR